MILDKSSKKRPEIEYPCEWKFKLIGDNVNGIVQAAEDAAKDHEFDLTASNISRKGNYFSLNLVVIVQSETDRNLIYEKLNEHVNIKLVI
ncbi:MAG: DUF493 domain-containing protein [Melioribacteraceae bacterium]|nr:DUF493 domain-containing protein [Melioribacteraceae bacterium]MCF8353853.1 DUF493 domain-containing protein [Melioribacteraceae bacterium]MCF8393086.1 DUF493 domain-containing protein [Melioribacteraceae bacterium]MCF8419205.1 DUF493 domain-containing protein [Melioribacteraceae bacterium]